MSDKIKKEFIICNKAWYSDARMKEEDEICLGNYTDDNFKGEFSIIWKNLGNEFVPQLKMFDDSWCFFEDYQELFLKLISLHCIPIKQNDFVKILKDLGFEDITEYKCPIVVRKQEKENAKSLIIFYQEKIKELQRVIL